MKKLSILFAAVLLFAFTTRDASITDEERKTAVDLLEQTRQGVIDAVAGLSDAQLNFKAAPDKWSVLECVKHIAMAEQGLWHITDSTIHMAANPEKRNEIKVTDDKQLVQMVESREKKVKTVPPLEPQNIPYKSLDEALEAFKTNRTKLIEYVKTTNDDLRNHVVAFGPGSFDSYQMVLFIGAHSNRHTKQIDEVKADPNFPKN